MDLVFRDHYRYLVARLTAMLGPARLEMAEDVVAEAMLRALKQWPFKGVPSQPRAWLLKVARNLVLDRLKHLAVRRQNEEGLSAWTTRLQDRRHPHGDEELAMMFMACHPRLRREARITLTLKVVGGFSVGEIARAFLSKERTIAQRLVRARRVLAQGDIRFEVPQDMQHRLPTVLEVLYLMFTEGHLAHEGDRVVRADICGEALRLTELLARLPAGAAPRVSALAALMCLHAARLPGRTDDAGQVLLLAEQDRRTWDQGLIRRGVYWLGQSARGRELSPYHLEAEIAAHHTLAPSFAATDWSAVLDLYDQLLAKSPGPIIALNRAVVLEKVAGPAKALSALQSLSDTPALSHYYPYHLAQATMLAGLNRPSEARQSYETALRHCGSDPVRRHIQKAQSRLSVDL